MYMTVRDVAAMLQKSEPETREWLVAKSVPRINISLGKTPRWRYRQCDVESILEGLLEIPGKPKRKSCDRKRDVFDLPVSEQFKAFNRSLTHGAAVQ